MGNVLDAVMPKYIEHGDKKIKVEVLQSTPSSRIIMHLVYRHRVGLLMFSTVAGLAYILYDQLLFLFF